MSTLTINSNQKFPLASTLKVLIAFNFVKAVTNKRFSINDKVELDELDKFYLPNTDGDAHPRWKKSINNPADVSLMEVAKGMMQFSSNACTDFLINKIGIDTINNSLDALQLDSHDQITYLTPPILMPRYLSDKKKIARQQLESMAIHKYQELSKELFEKMTTDGCNDLKENMLKMLDHKTQLAITKKMPSSTTREYADFMYELGGNLLSEKEKDLFSEIVIGKNIKSEEDAYFWYKGGATMFVLTSALYRKFYGNTIAVSLFIKDDTGGELYWIRNIFNDFVISTALDADFREKVKESLR